MTQDIHLTPHTAICTDGTKIACYRSKVSDAPPVIIAHGTFSSHTGCIGLAQNLADRGFDVWLFDWRGRGQSDKHSADFDFDTIAQQDIPAVRELVQRETGYRAAHWACHSGGGLVVSMWMARNPDIANTEVAGVAMMAAQAHLAAATETNLKTVTEMAEWLKDKEWIPVGGLGVGSEPESAQLMRQWCSWNLNTAFIGNDGFAYLPALKAIKVPVLALAGAGDPFIAPPAGCEALAKAFGGSDVTYQICGKNEGFLEDYEHGRILVSSSARKEIWPLVANWIENREKPAMTA